MKGGVNLADNISGLITALNTAITSFFSVDTGGQAAVGIGLLTGTVLAIALLRKGANKSKKVIG